MEHANTRTRQKARPVTRCLATLFLLTAIGCATSSGAPGGPASEQRITFAYDKEVLGIVVRELARQSGKGFVLMNGIENTFTGPHDFKNAPLDTVAEQLALDAQCALHTYPDYAFIYSATPLYEVLTGLTVEGLLPQHYEDVKIGIAFSAGTPLFNCMALMGLSAGMTLVADNALAAAPSGELALSEVSLPTAIEGLLRSARIRQDAFTVEIGENYAFFRSVKNRSRPEPLLNRGHLSPGQRERLKTQVNVRLPMAQATTTRLEAQSGAQPLGEVLPTLSRQLGIPVHAEPGLEGLPVNPVVMNHVSVETAMNLIIRQWPLPDFGWEFTERGITVRSANPPAP